MASLKWADIWSNKLKAMCDATGEYLMLYFDERKVSRKNDGSNAIIFKGELSKDNMTCEKDMELPFNRIK